MEKKNITSPLILLVAAIIWGFAFSAQVVAAENGLGGFTFNGIRFIIGGISLIPVALIFEREKLDRAFVKNTALPATLAGVLSEGMLLCAEDADGNLALMTPEKDMPAGAEVC